MPSLQPLSIRKCWQAPAACLVLGWGPRLQARWIMLKEESISWPWGAVQPSREEKAHIPNSLGMLAAVYVLRSLKKETIVEIWAFSGEMGLELDFKGIEQIIIWTGIMYYRMNFEAAIHWPGLADFIYWECWNKIYYNKNWPALYLSYI